MNNAEGAHGARAGGRVMKYRKKAIAVKASQWFKNGDHIFDAKDGEGPFKGEGKVVRYYRTPDLDGNRTCLNCGKIMHVHGWIDTLEGGSTVCPGDWIITGVKGEYSPCKPDIFAETYEPIAGTEGE